MLINRIPFTRHTHNTIPSPSLTLKGKRSRQRTFMNVKKKVNRPVRQHNNTCKPSQRSVTVEQRKGQHHHSKHDSTRPLGALQYRFTCNGGPSPGPLLFPAEGNSFTTLFDSAGYSLPPPPCQAAWRRTDGQPCTREHLLMALADITVFMIRATYADSMAESR